MDVSWLAILFGAIQLTGVTGSDLRVRAFFDANNVKVGDPMTLTIDFLGEADFRALHPPALSRTVDRRDWKLDDVSAKTDTFRDARRLTYRVRPMRAGVLWFPALAFAYEGADGKTRLVRSNEIPVHAKGGAQVVVKEMDEIEEAGLPSPPALVDAPPSLSPDESFAWRMAMAKPTADAFAAFDFPEARLNEATCAIREGNWARALKIYRRLEWSTGQTSAIERGMVAALALRHDNPAVELPVWRQVGRPLLKYAWPGRVGLVVGGFAALAFLLWLVGRGIRAVACVAVCLLAVPAADAQGIFEHFRQMEEQMNRMHQQMQQSFGGGFSFGIGEKEVREPIRIVATVETDKKELQVGDPFAFVISLEYPKTASVGQIRLVPTSAIGLSFTGQAENLADGVAKNPTNVVKRLSLPARYDVPYRGTIAFAIEGMVSGRETRGGFFSMTFSNSFRCETSPIRIAVKPLPTDRQPPDFTGIISEGLRIHETCDLLVVETNDVVTATYRMFAKGYVPDGFLPKGAAFEWVRQEGRDGRPGEIEYRRYIVADGRPATPKVSITYYDPRTKTYRTATTGETTLRYKAAPSTDETSRSEKAKGKGT